MGVSCALCCKGNAPLQHLQADSKADGNEHHTMLQAANWVRPTTSCRASCKYYTQQLMEVINTVL
eukprot:1159679-Pelagomonas_calceolata.AAC.2